MSNGWWRRRRSRSEDVFLMLEMVDLRQETTSSYDFRASSGMKMDWHVADTDLVGTRLSVPISCLASQSKTSYFDPDSRGKIRLKAETRHAKSSLYLGGRRIGGGWTGLSKESAGTAVGQFVIHGRKPVLDRHNGIAKGCLEKARCKTLSSSL